MGSLRWPGIRVEQAPSRAPSGSAVTNKNCWMWSIAAIVIAAEYIRMKENTKIKPFSMCMYSDDLHVGTERLDCFTESRGIASLIQTKQWSGGWSIYRNFVLQHCKTITESNCWLLVSRHDLTSS